MSRDIKFRGKRFDNDGWAYGNLIIDDSGNCEIVDYEDNCELRYNVRGETIGQFTGLHDANGKEIYEGDILFMGEDDGCKIYNEVGVKDGCFGYIGEITGELVPFCEQDVTEIVAGNVFDNPELLKGGEK